MFWIAIATVCWSGAIYKDSSFVHAERYDSTCVQQVVRASSTSLTAQKGETIYKVIPATATQCGIFGHTWGSVPDPSVWGSTPGYHTSVLLYPRIEKCRVCGKKRRKVAINPEQWEWQEE